MILGYTNILQISMRFGDFWSPTWKVEPRNQNLVKLCCHICLPTSPWRLHRRPCQGTSLVDYLELRSFAPSRVAFTADNFKIPMSPGTTAVAVVLFSVTMWTNGLNNGSGLPQYSQGYQTSNTLSYFQAPLVALLAQTLAHLPATMMPFGTMPQLQQQFF